MSLLQLLQRLDTNRALTVYLLKRMLICFYHICACVTFVYCTSKDTWRPETQGQFHCTSPPGLALLKECGSGKANSCRTFMRKCWPQWVWNFPGSDTRHTRQQWGPSIFGLIWKTAVDSQPRLRQPGDVPQWSLFHFCSVMTEQQREWGKILQKQEVCLCGEPMLQRKMCIECVFL